MSATTNSERIRQKIELLRPEFAAASAELAVHPRFRDLYPEMLVRIYWMIRASVRMLQATLGRCRALATTDAVAVAMIPYIEQHILEEMHHDEWVLEDL